MRFNGESCEPLYRELIGNGSTTAAETLASRLETLRAAAGLPATLRQAGITEGDLGGLAELAAGQWTAGFNPRPVGVAELRRLYEAAR